MLDLRFSARPPPAQTRSTSIMQDPTSSSTIMSVGSQIAASSFASAPAGHAFVLRAVLARPTAWKCAECGTSALDHARCEVADGDLAKILDVCADSRPSEIPVGHAGCHALLVGSCKAVVQVAAVDAAEAPCFVLNCAGSSLHAFLPKTRGPFDRLREAARLRDVEWADSDNFILDFDEIAASLRWIRRCLAYVHLHLHLPFKDARPKSRSRTKTASG